MGRVLFCAVGSQPAGCADLGRQGLALVVAALEKISYGQRGGRQIVFRV